ncbi:wax ester/triacylglycerol synthase family O-acyltransferase [Nocardia sp. CS682]|uniref:wax ester/triacylglycerol synthase family O-acyltransferase n=1 Tax=Nocardia sp. CS682 TaxID=1047172 RepID=UPI0010752647|nr:wax ester/triacylglycerol synthase family O-acyltransferase [Nocardia sp. CS682]QBS45358.1 wax ester/triacylglycerol synthase family O-acyltransferase [Nocardia sp. CS682]
MTELSPLDSGFIELEDSDRHVSVGIGAIAVVAGSPPPRAQFAAELTRRLTVDDRLRQKVRRTPWDLAAPAWVDDPDFDLAHHLRWMALPEPADESMLYELVAEVMEERLDRDHPLWQCVVVERLVHDRWAMIVKAHHSMVDGVSGITLFERLCDPAVEAAVPQPAVWKPVRDEGTSGVRSLVMKGLRLPIDGPRLAVDTLRAVVPMALSAVLPAPGSSLNGPIGRQRRYAVARASLPAVREIGAVFGATVNDVVLAAVAAAFRALLLARGEEPTADKVRILAPVSVRPADAKYVLDNRVSATLPLLPIESADLVQQLGIVHSRMSAHKASGEASAANSMLSLARLLPFASIAWTVRLVSRFPQHGISGLATNVPGPRRRLYLHGHEVLEILAYAPIAMRVRTGIAILSYSDQLTLGITGDFDSTPDLHLVAGWIQDAIDELLARARDAACLS